jgi:hypothetical protein
MLSDVEEYYIETTVILNVMPRRLVDLHHLLGGTFCLQFQVFAYPEDRLSTSFRRFGKDVPDFLA